MAALRQFSLICGLPKFGSGTSEEFQEARRQSNNLYAHLSSHDARYVAYVTATAYAVFCLRDNHDRGKVERVEAARARVDAHLRDSAAPFDVPDDDVVCQFAREALPNVGNPLWLRL